MRLLVSKVMLQACFEMLSVSKVLCRPWTKKKKKKVLTLSGKDSRFLHQAMIKKDDVG